MELYILLDGLLEDERPENTAKKLMTALSDWLDEADGDLSLVDQRSELLEDWQIGLALNCRRKAELKAPLLFLSDWAKKAEKEFVIGLYASNGDREDVCYFGFEEGRPDVNEIAMYIGLNK